MTASNRDHPAEAPPANTITLGARPSTCEPGGDTNTQCAHLAVCIWAVGLQATPSFSSCFPHFLNRHSDLVNLHRENKTLQSHVDVSRGNSGRQPRAVEAEARAPENGQGLVLPFLAPREPQHLQRRPLCAEKVPCNCLSDAHDALTRSMWVSLAGPRVPGALFSLPTEGETEAGSSASHSQRW